MLSEPESHVRTAGVTLLSSILERADEFQSADLGGGSQEELKTSMLLHDAIADSVRYLESPEARESLRRDPYWPKWHSPWWHMTLLWEMGLADRIPNSILGETVSGINSHFLKTFPFTDAEIPSGKEEFRHVVCHCALGTIDQVLWSRGIDLRREASWTAGWYERYQLPDGGLNCTKEAYVGSKKSSIVSTVPCLEAVLAKAPNISVSEEAFLDRGAKYLIDHRLVRSSRGEIIDTLWLKPAFPRFYLYDALRGAAFLTRWAKYRGRTIPDTALADAREWAHLDAVSPAGSNVSMRSFQWTGEQWIRGQASLFPLLERVGRVGEPCPYLRGYLIE
jgi:hypothetical protein